MPRSKCEAKLHGMACHLMAAVHEELSPAVEQLVAEGGKRQKMSQALREQQWVGTLSVLSAFRFWCMTFPLHAPSSILLYC